jgi:hypothetical protein
VVATLERPTSQVLIHEVTDRLVDGGFDLDGSIEDLTLEPGDEASVRWATFRPTGPAEQALFAHQVTDDVVHQLTNPERIKTTTLYLGRSAIGKTQAIQEGVRRAAELMGRASILDVVHLSQLSLVDALGVPRASYSEAQVRAGAIERHHAATYFALPENWPTEDRHPEHARAARQVFYHLRETGEVDWSWMNGHPLYTVFLDEMTNPSSDEVVHQFFPLILDRTLGGRQMVMDYAVIAAGNRVEDGCNSISLSVSATTRMALKEVVPNFPGWIRWGMQPRFPGSDQWKIHPLVIGFLWLNNEHFAPSHRDVDAMTPFASPRAWEFVSEELYVSERANTPDFLLKPAIAGRIGGSVTNLFYTYLLKYRNLPNVDALMRGEEIRWPPKQDIDVFLMIGAQMVKLLDEGNANRFMQILLSGKHFRPEMVVMIMKMIKPTGKLKRLTREWAPQRFVEFVHFYKKYSWGADAL